MKICRFNTDRIGVVEDASVLDVTEVLPPVMREPSAEAMMQAVAHLRGLERPALRACTQLPIHACSWLAPIPRPGKIVAAPVNYRAHIEEMLGNSPEAAGKHRDIDKAGLFLKASSSLAGASEPLRLRFPERRTDYEVELVVVIGKLGTAITREEALSHVAGYCLGLDITLRGPEDRSFRKSIDGYSIVGPWLTTADEIADPNAVDIRLSVNGEIRQQASTSDMVFDVQRLIQYASSFYTLHPGDLLFTGTPQGVGPLRAGDVMDSTGSGLGEMRVVVAGA